MKISDYIHYYIGSTATYRLRYVDQPAGQWCVPLRVTSKRVSKLDDASIEAIELFLRKLESMTEDEYSFILDNYSFCDVDMPMNQKKFAIEIAKRLIKQMPVAHYLLRQGFDLFGLIDAGLAVDANEIQK